MCKDFQRRTLTDNSSMRNDEDSWIKIYIYLYLPVFRFRLLKFAPFELPIIFVITKGLKQVAIKKHNLIHSYFCIKAFDLYFFIDR